MRIPYAKAPVPPADDPLERVLRARRLPFEVDGVTLYVRPPTLRESWQADFKERFSREAVRTQPDAGNLRSQPPSAMFADMVASQIAELRRIKKQTKEVKAEISRLEGFSLLDEMAAEYASNERDLYLCWRCVVDADNKPVFDQGDEDALDKHPDAQRIYAAARPVIWAIRRDESRPLAVIGQNTDPLGDTGGTS